LDRYINEQAPRPKVIAVTPGMFWPTIPTSLESRMAPSTITFLGRQYRLGAFNPRPNAMWEFITDAETVDNGKTLLTIIERPDARTPEDLDRLAEGVLSSYRSRGGKILAAKTVGQTAGGVFNYVVAAFDKLAERRCELDFVKISLESTKAVMV